MLTLYKVCFYFRPHGRQLQPIIASAANAKEATSRARSFIATHYTEPATFEEIEKICKTPDDVLDWS